MTFMEMYMEDMVEEGDIDAHINDWHNAYAEFGGEGFMSLWDFLGLTSKEWNHYLKKGNDYLRKIKEIRKNKKYD